MANGRLMRLSSVVIGQRATDDDCRRRSRRAPTAAYRVDQLRQRLVRGVTAQVDRTR